MEVFTVTLSNPVLVSPRLLSEILQHEFLCCNTMITSLFCDFVSILGFVAKCSPESGEHVDWTRASMLDTALQCYPRSLPQSHASSVWLRFPTSQSSGNQGCTMVVSMPNIEYSMDSYGLAIRRSSIVIPNLLQKN